VLQSAIYGHGEQVFGSGGEGAMPTLVVGTSWNSGAIHPRAHSTSYTTPGRHGSGAPGSIAGSSARPQGAVRRAEHEVLCRT